jgi:hypothetical protein
MLRFAGLGAAFALVVAACGTTDDADGDASSPSTSDGVSSTKASTTTTTEPEVTPAVGVLPEGPSALETRAADEFPEPLVNPGEIIPGGPPPDGIPPIEDPVFLDVADSLDLLPGAEPVVALEINGDARAYPVRVLIWHEIVNDTVGDVPVSVTYCPLCNSAVTYRREVRGVETTFGTSGSLFASALVMYDRATESLWTHFDGRAVVGVLAGDQLEAISSPLLAWEDFRTTYPDGLVLDPGATGFSRRYGANPYQGYDDPETDPFLFRGVPDNRALAKQRVVGINHNDEAVAYSIGVVSEGEAKATNVQVGGDDLAIFWKAGQATALEAGEVGEGRDVGSVSVFRAEVDGETLTFVADGNRFLDEQTRSEWLLSGAAVEGPLAGSSLERINHLDTFWFAWATYQPGTALIENP